MVTITEKVEEILEMLWIARNEKKQKGLGFEIVDARKDDDDIGQLVELGYITVEGDSICLTEAGEIKGENVVRRHRLAEKLLVDVVDVSGTAIHETACKLEHYLKEGIEDKVCTLLGHPKYCPHGHHIPQGPCCRAELKFGDKFVIPLCQLKVGQAGKIAYIQGVEQKNLQSLSAMGILPGVIVRVKQNFPSHLFQLGNSEFAVDRQIAEAIFVRVEKE